MAGSTPETQAPDVVYFSGDKNLQSTIFIKGTHLRHLRFVENCPILRLKLNYKTIFDPSSLSVGHSTLYR